MTDINSLGSSIKETEGPAGTLHIKDHVIGTNTPLARPFEPTLNDRFIVYMERIPTYVIYKVIRPLLSVDGDKYKYDDLVLEMYNPINQSQLDIKSTSSILTEFEREGKTTFDEIKLSILGPIGDEVELWVFKNCKIKEIKYSTLSWKERHTPITITVRLSFEECIHEF